MKPSIAYPALPSPPLIPSLPSPLLVRGHKCGNFEGMEDVSEQCREGTLVGGHKCGGKGGGHPKCSITYPHSPCHICSLLTTFAPLVGGHKCGRFEGYEVVVTIKPSITYPMLPLPLLLPLTTFNFPSVGGHKFGNFGGREVLGSPLLGARGEGDNEDIHIFLCTSIFNGKLVYVN